MLLGHINFQMQSKHERSYDRSRQVQGIVLELIEDVNLKFITLWSVKIKRKKTTTANGSYLICPDYRARESTRGEYGTATRIRYYYKQQ